MIEMEVEKSGRALWLGDIMEFGQNLALALALMTFSGIAYFTEPVSGRENWHHALAGFCLVAAFVWSVATGFRFTDGLVAHTKLSRKGWLNTLLTVGIVVLSWGICTVATKIPDNNHIVSVCERFEHRTEDKIHLSDECQRLYTQRREYEKRLRGE